jgi:hypothetical protein
MPINYGQITVLSWQDLPPTYIHSQIQAQRWHTSIHGLHGYMQCHGEHTLRFVSAAIQPMCI